jgi:hypothetical protein
MSSALRHNRAFRILPTGVLRVNRDPASRVWTSLPDAAASETLQFAMHLRKHLSPHQTGRLQLTKLLGEHLLRHPRQKPLQFGEPLWPIQQTPQRRYLPPPTNQVDQIREPAVLGSGFSHNRYPFGYYGTLRPNATQWNGLSDVTDARLLVRHLQWAATTPEARDQALHVVNGDIFRWS